MITFLAELELKATGVQTIDTDGGETRKVRKVSKCVPFELHPTKPRLIPEPVVISRQLPALPVPQVIYATNLEKVQEEKKERLEEEKERVQHKYPKELEFNFETAKRAGVEEKE